MKARFTWILLLSWIVSASFAQNTTCSAEQLWERYGHSLDTLFPASEQPAKLKALGSYQGKVLNYFEQSPRDLEQVGQVLAHSSVARESTCASLAEPTTNTVSQFLQTQADRLDITPKVDIHQVFVRVDANESSETVAAAKERAERVLQNLLNGASFREMAEKYSDSATSRLLGGSVGTITKGQINPVLEEVLFSMKEGETTGPIQSKNGFHVFRLDRIRPVLTTPEEITSAAIEHIKAENCGQEFASRIEMAKVEYLPTQSAPTAAQLLTENLKLKSGTEITTTAFSLYLKQSGLQTDEFATEDADLLAIEWATKVLAAELDRVNPALNSDSMKTLSTLFGWEVVSTLYWPMRHHEIQPTEQQLTDYFENNKGRFKPDMRYSGRQLQIVILDSVQSLILNAAERHAVIEPLRQRIVRELNSNTSITLEQIANLPFETQTTATIRNFANVEASGPEFAALAMRTNDGKLSEVFEYRNGLLILELTGRNQPELEYEKVKSTVLEAFKTRHLQQERQQLKEKLTAGRN